MKINPYINFNGNCREAMNFYKSCLGGEVTFLTIGESPMASQCPEGKADQIMHAHLASPVLDLMGSDMGPEMGPDQTAQASRVSIVVQCGIDEAPGLFDKLSAGGSVYCPLGPAFWGGTFGMVFDKFGIGWLITGAE